MRNITLGPDQKTDKWDCLFQDDLLNGVKLKEINEDEGLRVKMSDIRKMEIKCEFGILL